MVSRHEKKEYYNAVKRNICCGSKNKSEFLDDFSDKLSDYIDENPKADIDELIKNFGSPEEIADSFMQTLDEDEIQKAVRKKKIIITIAVCCVILLAVAVTVTFFTQSYINSLSERFNG